LVLAACLLFTHPFGQAAQTGNNRHLGPQAATLIGKKTQ